MNQNLRVRRELSVQFTSLTAPSGIHALRICITSTSTAGIPTVHHHYDLSVQNCRSHLRAFTIQRIHGTPVRGRLTQRWAERRRGAPLLPVHLRQGRWCHTEGGLQLAGVVGAGCSGWKHPQHTRQKEGRWRRLRQRPSDSPSDGPTMELTVVRGPLDIVSGRGVGFGCLTGWWCMHS